MISKPCTVITVIAAVVCLLSIAADAGMVALNSEDRDRPQIWPAMAPGPYAVGYMVKHEYDHTRTFRSKLDYFGKPRQGPIARPLQISVWYPAESSADPEYMKFQEYFHARATETDFTPPTPEQLNIVINGLKHAWPIEFRVEPERRETVRRRIDESLKEEVFAVKNATPAQDSFPLIIHMPGYNGSPSGHSSLFEFLASHGYVVAAVPNMGMYRRNIDNEAASLEVQARDLEFVAAHMSDIPFVNGSRIGTTGMSWGGMSNVLYAARNHLVDAVLTLDGAITMPEELDLIESIAGYSHKSLDAAYMQLLVCPAEAKFRPKDLRFYDSLEFCDAHMIQFAGVDHDAFSCSYLRLRNLSEVDPGRIAYLEEFSREIYRNALSFFDAYLKDDATALETLTSGANSGSQTERQEMIVLRDLKKGMRRPLTRKEFVNIIRTQGAEEASEIYKDYCRTKPQNNLIVSSVIGPVYMNAFESGDLEEALAICELWETALPGERGPLFSKGRIYTRTGETKKAIQCYEKVLRLGGEGRSIEIARERLNELRSEPQPEGSIRIRWLGHASFLMTTAAGMTILTDPIDFKGYSLPEATSADIVTVSHEHVDHNCTQAVSGSPAIFRGTDERCRKVNVIDTSIGDVRLFTVPSFHDPGHHGRNAIFVFEFDGVRIAHLGDIGTVLTDDQIDLIGDVDILMVPVGGQFTIAGSEADIIVDQLNVKRLVLPMHYRTEAFDAMPFTVDPFLTGKESVRKLETNELVLDTVGAAPSREYVVLRY
ncbi:MAG: MBL fold metallo-hydrolase [Candidatus Zixiibacteriota bacterium]|nr:MAG: MBL fold metallo-hydrolase [candidate division Zixibacteria bacterium]